jgi:thiol-disulfide isomerase/thioredoxin
MRLSLNHLGLAAIALTFAALGFWASSTQRTPPPTSVDPVQLFFQSEFPEHAAGLQKMSQWKGKPIIVNFWASWCPPCIREMPELSEFSKEMKKHGVQVIGLGVDTGEHIAEFAKQHPVDYPLYVAGITGSELSRQLGNETGGLPFTIIIGSDGKIKHTYLGLLNFKQLRWDIAPFLK